MMITRHHGSWVVLGTLITDVELEPTPPLAIDCGSCRLCIDACPTGALDEPGTLDATKCLSYWTQTPAPIPAAYREALGGTGLRLRHLPGRLPVEPRDRETARGPRSRQRGARRSRRLARRRRRLFRASLHSAQRRALAEAQRPRGVGQRGRRAHAAGFVERHANGDDAMLAEHARAGPWSRWRLVAAEADRALDRRRPPGRGPVRDLPGRSVDRLSPAGYATAAWVTTGIFAVVARPLFLLVKIDVPTAPRSCSAFAAQLFDTAVVSAYVVIYSYQRGTSDPGGAVHPAGRGLHALRDRRRDHRRGGVGAGDAGLRAAARPPLPRTLPLGLRHPSRRARAGRSR